MERENFAQKYPEEFKRLFGHYYGDMQSEKLREEGTQFLEWGLQFGYDYIMDFCDSREKILDACRDDRRLIMSFVRAVVLVLDGRLLNLSDEQLSSLLTPEGWKDVEISLNGLLTPEPGQQN